MQGNRAVEHMEAKSSHVPLEIQFNLISSTECTPFVVPLRRSPYRPDRHFYDFKSGSSPWNADLSTPDILANPLWLSGLYGLAEHLLGG